MNQQKFYHYIIFGLVSLNVLVLIFFLLIKPSYLSQSASQNTRSEIIKILRLNQQQTTTFMELADAHQQRMKEIDEQQEILLTSYFGSLAITATGIDNDSLLHQYQQAEREKVEVTYRHFQEIKSLLNPDQIAHFEKFMKIVTGKLLSNEKKSQLSPKDSD